MASLNMLEWSLYVQYFKSYEQVQIVVFTIRKQLSLSVKSEKKHTEMPMKKFKYWSKLP